MTIILSGGGTAGHVHPALAIAEEFMKFEPDCKIIFVGRAGGQENRAVEKSKIKVLHLDIKGIERKLTVRNIKNILLALKARRKAAKIISEYSPDVVIGTGGYVCWPIIRAAQAKGIPTVIHESNAEPGLVCRLVYKKCDKVLLNHKETEKHLSGARSVAVVGNPLRTDFTSVSRERARQILRLSDNDIFIVSFGGSGGAEEINRAAIMLMREFSEKNSKIKHLHATGRKFYDDYKDKIKSDRNEKCKIVPYIDNMPTVLRAADIVICRSGAITLSELALVGAASILIPSPNVTNNHQYKNAKLLSDKGAAILITEDELKNEKLINTVAELSKSKDKRKELSQCIEKFAIQNSGKKALLEIKKIMN